MTDHAAQYATGLTGPALGGETVVPSDTSDLPNVGRGLLVTSTGNVKVTTRDGSILTLNGVPAYYILPIIVKRVWATGTSATLTVLW